MKVFGGYGGRFCCAALLSLNGLLWGIDTSFASCMSTECDEHECFWYDANGGTFKHFKYDKTNARDMRSSTPLKGTRTKHNTESVTKYKCTGVTRAECTTSVALEDYPGNGCDDCTMENNYSRYFCAKGTPKEGVEDSWNEGEGVDD